MEALHRSEVQAARMEETRGGKTVVLGGSSCRTSYIPSVLAEEYSIPFANFGLHAGFGPDVVAEIAMRYVNPGDTVVVAIEPGTLKATGPSKPKSAGLDFLAAVDGLTAHDLKFVDISPLRFVDRLQGSTRYNLFMAMKRLRGMEPYRYTAVDNLHDDGWMEVSERRDLPFSTNSAPVGKWRVGESGRELLRKIQEECSGRGCKVMYQLPPALDGNPNSKYGFARLLLDVAEIMPVVKDPMLGVNPNPEEFADTFQHPARAGALRATRSFGKALAEKSFWTKGELEAIVEDGERSGAFNQSMAKR